MKENITVELKSKEALAYDQEQVKEWMDDLVKTPSTSTKRNLRSSAT